MTNTERRFLLEIKFLEHLIWGVSVCLPGKGKCTFLKANTKPSEKTDIFLIGCIYHGLRQAQELCI